MRRLWATLAVWGLGGLLASPGVAATWLIRYPAPLTVNANKSGHALDLLQLALKKSGAEFELRESTVAMVQARAIKQLENNQDIDILWTMTSMERERQLLPIRIPLDKGMLGWRLLLIHKRDADKFAQVKTFAQLKPLLAAQGSDWPDSQILEANGLQIVTRSEYDNLLQLLDRGQVDYFPRSAQEIWGERERMVDSDIEVEPTLLIRYPTALYFFVNKKNAALARVLEAGLRKAIKDGSFEKLFQQYYGESIRRAKFKTRTTIRLNNPLLSPETPLNQEALWFHGSS